MASKSLQYDAAVGGTVKLPEEIDSVEFNEERLTEMKTLLRNIASTEKQTKLMHQSLPLHMRRRAMTYNPKRLPRKFRSIHLAQFSKSGLPEKKKRPSRKYRRKTANLLKEYERRKRTNVWLETHIWHAKRFHMTAKWGYKIPYTPTRKVYRACYRATAKHCLLQDTSYMGCIEICGPDETLKNGLSRLCSQEIGLTITAKAFLGGRRSGNVHLYEKDRYPFDCIGKIRFLWRAQDAGSDGRTLWIFAHPVFYKKLIQEFIGLFGLKNVHRHDNAMEVNASSESKIKEITTSPGTVRIPQYVNKVSGVTIKELKDALNYFRLAGPLSHVILGKALKTYKPSDNIRLKHWYTNWSEDLARKKVIKEQLCFWDNARNLTSTVEFTPGLVIGLVIADPRLNRPKKRTKALPGTIMTPQCLPENTIHTAFSPLWDHSIRDRIFHEMQSTHELNLLRAKECLVPGEKCAFEDYVQPIPVLLIQNPGSQDAEYKRLGYGSGWDLIVPAGYGLAVWQTLIMWGAKPAGLKEFDMQALETGVDLNTVPDTVLGKSEADVEYEKCWNKYFSRPNNRRVNYKKYAIASPFRCPWGQLVSEWVAAANPPKYYVLRDQEALGKIQLSLQRKFNIKSAKLSAEALIPLFLTMKSRGNPGDNSIICLPLRHDFRKNKQQGASHDNSPVYTEPLRKDPCQKERHLLRSSHLRLLKRLRNRRIREKKARQRKNPGTLIRIARPQNQTLIREQLVKIRELWLPAKPSSVRNQCSRECFGYVTRSSFSLSEGKVTALGYVTAKGLEKLFKICIKGTFKVLVRGTKSRCYRFATIKVRVEQTPF
ncbi:ribonucleases P/MRP protein subunit POP1 [Toxorhynchites rutilus septentrionalis]|uniref:ribonucleases P/MRP protein subunit POP1 n=1 Tax=Toxorhynchites rutilus septentrionalis TaxID=329112 RepID=UPI00247A9A73|nr:ribonucleases P/MRP protein subunit POP1 [Toxorhynchites rutilus septentrionalis]